MHISLPSEVLFTVFGLPITNTLFTAWIVVAILCALSLWVSSRIKKEAVLVSKKPETGVGTVTVASEMVVGGLLGMFASVVGNEEKARKFFPIVATIFIFVLAANWFGIVPGMGSVMVEGIKDGEVSSTALLRTVFSDLNMTLAIALVAVVMSHVYGIRSLGFKHLGKYFTFKNPILAFVGILEVVGEIAKIFSFSFRLFGNIFAGEVLLVIISFLVPIIAPIPFMGLELFVGLIQALIFSVLTLIFFVSAEEVAEH